MCRYVSIKKKHLLSYIFNGSSPPLILLILIQQMSTTTFTGYIIIKIIAVPRGLHIPTLHNNITMIGCDTHCIYCVLLCVRCEQLKFELLYSRKVCNRDRQHDGNNIRYLPIYYCCCRTFCTITWLTARKINASRNSTVNVSVEEAKKNYNLITYIKIYLRKQIEILT